MICKSCSFENKEGAVFCANCGKPLTQDAPAMDVNDMKPIETDDSEPQTVALDSAFDVQPEKEDDSEANTTVLTSELITPAPGTQAGGPAPQGFVSGPAPMGAPKPMGGPAPMGASNPMGGSAPMGAPKPMGGPAPMGAPKPMGGSAPAGAPQGGNTPKQNKPAKSGKTGTGAKVYIVISIILIVAMAGAGVWMFMHFNGKIDDISKEKDTLASQMDASSSSYESQLSDKDTEISGLESSVADYESQIADYESQIAAYEETSSSYSAYDALISFANSSAGQGYADFFASDTVLHLTGGDVAVLVYYGVQEDSNVIYQVENAGVATCEWGEDWNGDVATLYVTPVSSGNTIITLSNDVNDETIKIYVYVD